MSVHEASSILHKVNSLIYIVCNEYDLITKSSKKLIFEFMKNDFPVLNANVLWVLILYHSTMDEILKYKNYQSPFAYVPL